MAAEVDEVLARMDGLAGPLAAAEDPARHFLGTYRRLTEAIGVALDRGWFEDPAWVAHWDVVFAGLYLHALAAHGTNPASVPQPWRLAFGADPGLPPELHVLMGVNAHVNFDMPQSLLQVVQPDAFEDPELLESRHRDHERIDGVLAAQVAAEDRALERAGGRRTLLDRAAAPVNRRAVRIFLAEARRKVWANTMQLHEARLRGADAYAARVADLEAASAARVADLLRPGPVLLRLAVHGFGVRLPDVDQPG